jgi:hypothetical protein
MKQINKLIYFKTGLIVCLFLFAFTIVNAQVSSYSFTQSTGTYTSLTGGTVVATATDSSGIGSLDDVIYDLPAGTIPFSFIFDNTTYTGCKISTNGFITFGSIAPAASGSTTGYVPLSAVTAYNGAVAGLGRNLNSYFIPGMLRKQVNYVIKHWDQLPTELLLFNIRILKMQVQVTHMVPC